MIPWRPLPSEGSGRSQSTALGRSNLTCGVDPVVRTTIKAEVVGLVRTRGQSIPEVSRDLDLTESAVRGWVQRAETQTSRPGGLTTAEREELGRLRRQVRQLEEERTILKKAAVFFAKEAGVNGNLKGTHLGRE